jgi:hypothetical protein
VARGSRVWWTFGAASRYNEPDFFGLRGYLQEERRGPLPSGHLFPLKPGYIYE